MAMAELPAYSGSRLCPKFCASGIKVAYHAPHPSVAACRAENQEHLLRTCPVCGYQWAEACADNDAASPLMPAPDSRETNECPG